MPHTFGQCRDCENPLFRHELARGQCEACWRFDVDNFVDMIKLGLIGLRTPTVKINYPQVAGR